jgi:hypothetical protein
MNIPDEHHAQRARIRALSKKLQLPDNDPVPSKSLDSLESTLRYLATIDEEPSSTFARQLITDGVALPPPDSLRPDEIDATLQNVIIGLARRRTFLSYTNHLSNDELYRLLWEETLNEATHELDDSMGDCACHIDLLSDGSEQSNLLRLQYYADELERNDWLDGFPDDTLPPHLDPPYDRDRHLPQRSGKPT